METLRAFIPSLETRIRQLNVFRRNGGKRARDFIVHHPVLALFGGIVGVCSVPALLCLAIFAALSIMVFFSVQGTLAGLTCVALATVVGPVFMTGLSMAIFCYVVLKIVQGVYRILKYVASIPFQIWTKVITVIENMAYSGQSSLYTVTSRHALPDISHSPVNQTVRCQSDLRSMRIINSGCLASAIPDIPTVNARPNELFFGHAALIDGEPIRIKLSSNERRKVFRNIFGERDPVEVLRPELTSTDNGGVSKERYKTRLREIEERVCQSPDDDSDSQNAVGKNGNSHETPTRNRNNKQSMNNDHEEVYRKTGGKPMRRQGSDSESDSPQTDSGRQYSEKDLRRKHSRHLFEPMYRGEPEGYRKAEQTQTRSYDGDTYEGYSSRTAWNNRKQQHVSADKRAKRQGFGRTKGHKFVMSESEAGSEPEQLRWTSDSGRSAVSGERERCRNEERVRRIWTSETNSDSEQSGPVFYKNKRRKHRVTKKNSDHEWERVTSRSHNSGDEPSFNKEPVATSSGRRQLPNKGKCSNKSRDRWSCDHYRVHCSGQRQICCNHKAAEDSHPWDTRVAPSPSWASRSEHTRGTDYDDVTTSEREFYDAMEEAASNDEEYVYY